MIGMLNHDAGLPAGVGTRDDYWQALNDILEHLSAKNSHLFPIGMKTRRFPRIAA